MILLIHVVIGISVVFALYSVYALKQGAPFLPTGRRKVKQMIIMAKLQPTDVVMDLGSGDGRIIFAAAPHVSTAIGIEINPILCYTSKLWAYITRKNNVKFFAKNFWNVDISQVDVLMLFCIKDKMSKMQNKIEKEMKPGSRILSNIFSFNHWEPKHEENGIRLYIKK